MRWQNPCSATLYRCQIRDSYARMSAYANAYASDTSGKVYDLYLVSTNKLRIVLDKLRNGCIFGIVERSEIKLETFALHLS